MSKQYLVIDSLEGNVEEFDDRVTAEIFAHERLELHRNILSIGSVYVCRVLVTLHTDRNAGVDGAETLVLT